MEYFKRETAEVGRFIDSLKNSASLSIEGKNTTFDSAAAVDFLKTASHQSTDINVPETMQIVLDETNDAPRITKAVFDGICEYEVQHGMPVPADVVEMALHSAYATTNSARSKLRLDSANSNHHDPLSLQPNRAAIAILTTLAEAIPYAHYLPADIGSNEAKLAIMSHQAGSEFGSYKQGDSLDGINGGDSYISTSRLHTSKPDTTGVVEGKITKIQKDANECDPGAGDVKLLRGRTEVYADGRLAATEMNATGSGASPVSGVIKIANVSYTIAGSINTDTGVYKLTSTPALPATISVAVEGYIDFERQPDLTPTIIAAVDTFSLYAKAWRVKTHQTIDSRTQMANELGLDPYGESIISIQSQFANERHYQVLHKGLRLAGSNRKEFNLDYASRKTDLVRAQMWQDFSYPLAEASQQMAIDTMNHGITHLYVTKKVAAQLLGLPSTLFQPSGLTPRPGIYRLGRLFGQYEVYFTPKALNETPTSAHVLAVGRATDVARNPVVLGDAVPPMVIPLAMGQDMSQGAAFYARNFTSINPHDPSSRGFALIEIINM